MFKKDFMQIIKENEKLVDAAILRFRKFREEMGMQERKTTVEEAKENKEFTIDDAIEENNKMVEEAKSRFKDFKQEDYKQRVEIKNTKVRKQAKKALENIRRMERNRANNCRFELNVGGESKKGYYIPIPIPE